MHQVIGVAVLCDRKNTRNTFPTSDFKFFFHKLLNQSVVDKIVAMIFVTEIKLSHLRLNRELPKLCRLQMEPL